MASTNHKLIYIKKPIELTGDPGIDMLVSALAASEEREGERKGWDKPPQLWGLYLRNPGQLDLTVVPPAYWRYGNDNPADDLAKLAVAAPEPPEHPAQIELAGFAGLAFMSEGWAVSPDNLTEQDERDREAGLRNFETHPRRVEVRFVNAVDINGLNYLISRERGKEQTQHVRTDRIGTVPKALHVLSQAIRLSLETGISPGLFAPFSAN